MELELKIAIEGCHQRNVQEIKNMPVTVFDLLKGQGFSILHLMSYIGDKLGCQNLIESGYSSNQALHTQLEFLLQKSLAYCYALSSFKFKGQTNPLLLAVFFRHFELIDILLPMTKDHDTLQYCLRLTDRLDVQEVIVDRIFERVCSIQRDRQFPSFRKISDKKDLKIGFIKVYSDDDPQKAVQFMGYCKELMFPKQFRYCGIDVYIQNPWQSREKKPSKVKYKTRGLTECENTEFHLCLMENSKKLWMNHSNLNVITASIDENEQLTVVFLCTSKGFIPVNEVLFPEYLTYGSGKKLPVKIHEGYFQFDMKDFDFTETRHEKLCMGADVAIEGGGFSGSLGFFVDLGNKKGFITCCHVLFDDIIKASGFEFDSRSHGVKNVVQPSSGERLLPNVPLVCGRVLKAVFKPDSSGVLEDETCVDAALVEITDPNRIPSKGCFTVRRRKQFQEEGFDGIPTFTSGSCEKTISGALCDMRLVKSGNTSGFTGGLFILNGSKIRYPCSAHLIAEGAIQNKQVFHGQYEVSGRTSQPFTLEGDSGAAVFLVKSDKSLHCIGMVIGHHYADGRLLRTVVTPIEPVLKSLGLETCNISQFVEDMQAN